MQTLAGRTAVVTGAASGIGRAVATRFAREGMNVVLADIERDALAETVAALEADGRSVLGVPTDVSKWEQVEALAERTVARFGAVHVVHNNAGVVTAGRAEQLTLADYEWVLGVDLWSVIYGVKAFLPRIEAAGEGYVVNTASTAGLVASAHIAPYNIAKFGVVALTETIARELALRNSPIGVSVLCPGAINTRIVVSDRNRPPASRAAHRDSAEEAQFRERAGALLANQGLDPARVADLVVEAMRARQFWILTHPDWKNVLKERIAALAENGRLASGFGG